MPKIHPHSKILKNLLIKKDTTKKTLWRGPVEDGITQSLLSRFLVCRERFRLRVIEGLVPSDIKFDVKIEYGNLWHLMEECYAAKKSERETSSVLNEYRKNLYAKYPTEKEQILHWFNVCKIQFPIYVAYWEKHNVLKNNLPFLQEETFKVSYEILPNVFVKLRGKFDAVHIIKQRKSYKFLIQENKSKYAIDSNLVQRQLTRDLQSMMYVIALKKYLENTNENKIRKKIKAHNVKVPTDFKLPKSIDGVLYNVVRRPLAGGKGTIKQRQKESIKDFYLRLENDYIAKTPQEYFARWIINTSKKDIEEFETQVFKPLLRQLYFWYNHVTTFRDNPFQGDEKGIHYITPFGFYNHLIEIGYTEYDDYLAHGSKVGLKEIDNLFPEL